MVEPTDPGEAGRKKEVRWAIVRLILGQAQIIGAVVSVYLVIQTGINSLSVCAFALTTACTILSRLIFRGKK